MKMTKEQVAELLLKMNDDLSNVEMLCFGGDYLKIKALDVVQILQDIIDGAEFRIKDNAVKEVTPDLLHKVFKHKTIKGCYRKISMITENRIYFNEDDSWSLESFNNSWQLVED